MSINHSIKLKSFAQIVQEVKNFYDDVRVTDMNDARSLKFVEAMANMTDSPTIENISYVLNVVNKYPDVEGVTQQERIEFNRNIKPHVFSHWCSIKDPHDFEASDEIKVSTTHCDHRDVILWCDEVLIVDYHQNGICHTITFESEGEAYANFKMGLEGEPHYILGKVCF